MNGTFFGANNDLPSGYLWYEGILIASSVLWKLKCRQSMGRIVRMVSVISRAKGYVWCKKNVSDKRGSREEVVWM